jgi:hypothetical protein
MYDREFPAHLSKLHDWYETMSDIEALKEISTKMTEVLTEHPQLKESSAH